MPDSFIACKICIARQGLKGSDIQKLPKTREEFEQHLRTEHNITIESYGMPVAEDGKEIKNG